MSLNEIVENSNYVTDEEITSDRVLGIANNCIAEVNRRVGTALPFFDAASLTDDEVYDAIPNYWVVALLEPYYSYAIMANDGDSNARDFHYERFTAALGDFKDRGIDEITSSKYAGNNVKSAEVDVSDITVHWGEWY